MPPTLTYPGVYIEEVSSGVHTITGVATSITAFIGRAERGPADDDPASPVTIHSFADFERTFGGLWNQSRLGYAVRDFFLHGGSTALIVRLANGGAAAELPLPTGGAAPNDFLPLVAANVGQWADNLQVTVDHNTKDPANTNLFNLTVVELDPDTGKPVRIEKFLNVSIDSGDPRYVPRILESGSSFVRVQKDGTGAWIVPNLTPQDGDITPTVNGDDGAALDQNSFTGPGKEADKQGLYALERADLFNLLCIPPYTSDDNVDAALVGTAATYCEEKKRAMLLVDPRSDWNTSAQVVTAMANPAANVGTTSKNAALFFPRLMENDPLLDNQLATFAPSGALAGIFARTDAQRGVWKAPAGLEASFTGVSDFSADLTDAENGDLNQLGVNCLRLRPAAGPVVWGARTLQGDDRLASEWKYIPVRRTALFIEESLYRGTQWVVFEPNDEPLWAQIRLNIGAFMQDLFRQGAFQGKTPKDAYFVKCDSETTTQNDINLGIVNIIVGFAPLKPAEFVVIQIQQMAGQIQT